MIVRASTPAANETVPLGKLAGVPVLKSAATATSPLAAGLTDQRAVLLPLRMPLRLITKLNGVEPPPLPSRRLASRGEIERLVSSLTMVALAVLAVADRTMPLAELSCTVKPSSASTPLSARTFTVIV